MADSGQRLLDVIDDANALESFLGTLTSETSVDNEVELESLARSLAAAAEFGVDSPNETLFEPLEPSGNLTDISQSNVQFDFGPVTTNSTDTNVFSTNQDTYSLSNGPGESTQLHHGHQDFSTTLTSTNCDSNTGYSSNTNATLAFSSNSSSLVYSSQAPSENNGASNESSTQQHQELQVHYTSHQQHLSSSLSSHNLLGNNSMSSEPPPPNSNSAGPNNVPLQAISATNAQAPTILSSNFQQQQSIQVTPVANSSNTAAQTQTILTTSEPQQQSQQPATHYASLGQIVQAQQQNSQAILTGMNQQLIATSSANGLPQAGIIIDQNGQPMMVATGGNATFSNVSLFAGVQPTYAVLPTSTSLFSNAITMQPQTIQTIKTTNGTSYLQTVSAAQTLITQPNATVSTAGQNIRPKQPPQLLPKPSNGTGGGANAQNPNNSNSGKSSQSGTQLQGNTGTTNNNTGLTVTTASMENFNQIIQQQAHSANNSQATVSFGQPSFAIGAGGQVVQVSGVPGVSTMSGPQTIVFNQFGQQMLVPAAAVGHSGVQFILRQQPAPTQVLAIQAPANAAQATATVGGKPIVRLMSQLQQARPQGQQIQLQQIQTANGPTWVLANTVNVAPQTQIQSQIVSVPTITQQSIPKVQTVTQPIPKPAPVPVVQQTVQPQHQKPPTPNPTPPPPSPKAKIDTISDCIASVIARLGRSPSPEPAVSTISTPQTKYSSKSKSPSHSESSNGPPPKKKPKQSKSKKKVALDLGQLLKQSGIMDEDLQDDDMMGSFSDFFSDPAPAPMENPGTPSAPAAPQQNGYYNSSSPSTPAISNNSTFKPNGTQGVQQQHTPYTHLPHTHILKPSSKTKQKKPAGLNKLLNSIGSDSIPPSQVIAVKTPAKSKSKKKNAQPTEIPATPPPPVTAIAKPSPKAKGKGKKAGSTPAAEMVNTVSSTTNPTPTTTPKSSKGKGKKNANKFRPESPTVTSTGSPVISAIKTEPATPTQSINASSLSSGPLTVGTPTISPSQTRIVQTIQLSPQNQQLLRNIQTQIQRLVSLPTRNEIEQSSLQKLVVLQQQVISTGTPVPNPPSIQTLSGTQVTGTNLGITVLKGPITPTATTPSISSSAIPSVVTSSPLVFTTNNSISTPIQIGKLIPTTTAPTLSTNISQPPPLILNNTSSTSSGKKFIITATQSPQLGSGVSNSLNNISRNDSYPESHRTLGSGQHLDPSEEKVTSSSINSIQTTTLSNTITTTSGNGFYTHNPVSVPELDIIDEKKLEEQLIARLKAEEEARIKWRKDEFDKRLENDHNFFLNPEYETPFKSFDDMMDRLMHYHVAIDKNQMNFEEFDDDFAETSSVLLEKFHGMNAKYRALLLKESMREVICAERVMLDRIFVGEERLKLDHDKNLVAQGEVLDLPQPPEEWIPKINEMVEAEMKDMERDSVANQQVQSAIDSIITFGNSDGTNYASVDEGEKVEYDAFGVPISTSNYNSMNSSSAAIDEAVRSILL